MVEELGGLGCFQGQAMCNRVVGSLELRIAIVGFPSLCDTVVLVVATVHLCADIESNCAKQLGGREKMNITMRARLRMVLFTCHKDHFRNYGAQSRQILNAEHGVIDHGAAISL